MTILNTLKNHSIEYSDKCALIEGERHVTYSQLWSNICKAASYYSRSNSKGDRVILSASKSIDFVFSYFGAQLAGLITLPIDPSINELRLNRIITSAHPEGIYGTLFQKDLPIDVTPFPDLTEEIESTFDTPSSDEIADILFTTGTTGLPKGVVLTHGNEYATACNINEFIKNTSEDVELLALPISHSFGLGRMRCTLVKGGTVVILGSFANVKRFFKEIEKHHVTGFGMVPASWEYIKKMSGDKLSTYANQLHYIEIGSAPMSKDEKTHLSSLLPTTRICMHYGLTEASRCTFLNFHEDMEHINSIGKPTPNVDIRIYSEEGQPLPPLKEGEICAKGGNVCYDYWGNHHDEYINSFYEGYFRTGDWGYMSEDGYFYLISRKKELINVGGKKLSPLEVEEVINSIPGIQESACIGIQDNVLGEAVKAFVVRTDTNLTPDQILDICRHQLEGYKVPTQIEFIDKLPKTSSGKLQRLLLNNNGK